MEKWKQLYLAIKRELDEPTQRTYDGLSRSHSLLFVLI